MPINQAFSGMLDRVYSRFKIGKKPTDIVQDAAVQNRNEINVDQNNQNVNLEQIQIDVGGGVKGNYIIL